ncbi:hypothetical protein LL13C14_38860 [Escherichia coli]
MLKQKIKTIFEALLYIMLTYWLIDSFFAFNKYDWMGNDSNLLIVFYVQIMPDDFVMQLHRF